MTNIIVVLPKLEEAKGVKSILVRSGFQVTGIVLRVPRRSARRTD